MGGGKGAQFLRDDRKRKNLGKQKEKAQGDGKVICGTLIEEGPLLRMMLWGGP